MKRALEDYPYSAQAADYLAEAELCLYKKEPERISIVLYELARAASVDPVQSMVDPKWQAQTIEPRLEDIYRQYHGSDPDGLKQLKELAVAAPFPRRVRDKVGCGDCPGETGRVSKKQSGTRFVDEHQGGACRRQR